MKMTIGDCFLEVLESGIAYYKHSPHRPYQAYKVIDDKYGVSYAVKEQTSWGRYGKGWFYRHLIDVTFIPTQTSIQLIGV